MPWAVLHRMAVRAWLLLRSTRVLMLRWTFTTWYCCGITLLARCTMRSSKSICIFETVDFVCKEHLSRTVAVCRYNIFSSTNLYNSYFTRLHLHAVYNTWLTPVTTCGSQSTACGMHWNETGKALDWCQLYFSGKYLVLILIYVLFFY